MTWWRHITGTVSPFSYCCRKLAPPLPREPLVCLLTDQCPSYIPPFLSRYVVELIRLGAEESPRAAANGVLALTWLAETNNTHFEHNKKQPTKNREDAWVSKTGSQWLLQSRALRNLPQSRAALHSACILHGRVHVVGWPIAASLMPWTIYYVRSLNRNRKHAHF